MNIANKLTLFRVFLVPIFIMSLLFLGINNIVTIATNKGKSLLVKDKYLKQLNK